MAETKNMRDIRDINREIDRTRARLNGTIDEIMDRFSAERLKDRAWDEIRAMTRPGSRARDTGSSLVNTIRNNPIPAAMTGAGLILLFARGSQGGRYQTQIQVTAEGEAGEAGEKVHDITQKAREKAQRLRGRVSEKTGYAGEELRELRGRAGEVKSIFRDIVEDNPLAVVAAAFAIGSALGLGLPETSKERELLGETGEALREKAAGTLEEAEKKLKDETDRAA
ncbi:MAG: hypothetical protein A2052_07960 [Deltaproteobacteria bacterium GWA2_54_12]|nr:MAG: hypothetical protein A2052_07960 [Deltaproteobacteria bacterium GWA2_54_12]